MATPTKELLKRGLKMSNDQYYSTSLQWLLLAPENNYYKNYTTNMSLLLSLWLGIVFYPNNNKNFPI